MFCLLSMSSFSYALANEDFSLPENHQSLISEMEVLGAELEKNWSLPSDSNDPNNLVINGWFNDSRLWKEAWVETRDAVTTTAAVALCPAALAAAVSACAATLSSSTCVYSIEEAAKFCQLSVRKVEDYVRDRR